MRQNNSKDISSDGATQSKGKKTATVVAIFAAILLCISLGLYYTFQSGDPASQEPPAPVDDAQAEVGDAPVAIEIARMGTQSLEHRWAEIEESEPEADIQIEPEPTTPGEPQASQQTPAPTEQHTNTTPPANTYTGGPEGAIGDPMTGPAPATEATSWSETGEPTSGDMYDLAQYYQATWYPERGRWEYTSQFGITRAIYPDRHTEILDAPEPTFGEGKVQAERVGAVWAPEFAGWVYYSDLGNMYVRIGEGGGSWVLSGEEIDLAKKYID